MNATTRIIYKENNSLGNQYAPQNCSGYGTKWKIHIWKKNDWAVMGCPILLDSNVTIDEKIQEKIEKSNRVLEYLNMGIIY